MRVQLDWIHIKTMHKWSFSLNHFAILIHHLLKRKIAGFWHAKKRIAPKSIWFYFESNLSTVFNATAEQCNVTVYRITLKAMNRLMGKDGKMKWTFSYKYYHNWKTTFMLD